MGAAPAAYLDKGGATAQQSVTYSIIDPTAPAIVGALTPGSPDGDSGWYRSLVGIDWTVTEAESPSSLTTTGCDDVTIAGTSVVKSFAQRSVACATLSAQADDIELTTTGGTSLRFDTTARQFVQNWQTPKTAGACYQAVAPLVDGSTIAANFKLK
jgi:hypothetical protein